MRPALLSAHRSPGLRPTSHAIWVWHTCDGHVLAHRGFIPCLQGAWFLWVITLFTRGHGSSKGVHDQPCESTGLTKRHARMTKTQQIGHLKGKTTNPSDFIPDNLCVIPETCLCRHSWTWQKAEWKGKKKRPTLVKCQKISNFLKANTCMI